MADLRARRGPHHGAAGRPITAMVPVFTCSRRSLQPFIPGIGLSAMLYAWRSFASNFWKLCPPGPHLTPHSSAGKPSRLYFCLFIHGDRHRRDGVFLFLNYEHEFAASKSQLASISALKFAGLSQWRSERLADAEIIAKNRAFSVLCSTIWMTRRMLTSKPCCSPG